MKMKGRPIYTFFLGSSHVLLIIISLILFPVIRLLTIYPPPSSRSLSLSSFHNFRYLMMNHGMSRYVFA